MAKDTCIMCGEETPYDYETHIDFRYGYVEGAGQLCKDCYEGKVAAIPVEEIMQRRRNLFTISEDDILSTPNDAELGAKVRQMYWENKN
jgi:hypothetical protein